jgi:predicted DNA-binding protein YlxM (UPF0122 family)
MAVISNCKSLFLVGQVAKSSLRPVQRRTDFFIFMIKQSPPKWIRGFKEIPFSRLTKTDNNGKVIESGFSDEGRFVADLYHRIDFEIITGNLGKKEKCAIQLRDDEKLSRKQIAQEMNISENAVKTLLYRAGKKIKGKIGKKYGLGRNPDYKKLLKQKIKIDSAYKKYKRKIFQNVR